MLKVLSNIAKSVLTKENTPVDDKVVDETVIQPTKIEKEPRVYSLSPFILDYLKSDNWHVVRDYINAWLIRYQVDNNTKLHHFVEADKGIGKVSYLSGKVTAADEFRLFLF